MRTASDRIRHTVLFEIIALVLVIPLGTVLFGLSAADVGAVGAGSAVIAMVWNYLYNLGFDHALRRLTGSVSKSWPVRVLHAVLFEGGLLIILVPPIAWYLGIGLLEALKLDLALAFFYVVYAFLFNLAYDLVFPAPA